MPHVEKTAPAPEGSAPESPPPGPAAAQPPAGNGETLTEAAASQATLAVSPEIVAGSLGESVGAWLARIRAGESGILPVVVGLVLIAVIFQTQNANFLTPGNLTNLLVQGAVIMLLGLGEVFALLLGEIDLSVGYVAGVAGVVAAELVVSPRNWPWWAAIAVALAVVAVIGLVQGTIITRLGLPSFVVTLAGLLACQGIMLKLVGQGGTVPIPSNVINDFANGNLTVGAGWVVTILFVAGFGALTWRRDTRRRASGLVAPPPSLSMLKILAVAAAGAALALLVNANRGALVPIQGMPWVVLIVLGVLAAWTVLLGRTRFGRYVYAIGGNAEAARRAGVNLNRIRVAAFTLAGLTAGIMGIIYASQLGGVSTNVPGGNNGLFPVAAAGIGGGSAVRRPGQE